MVSAQMSEVSRSRIYDAQMAAVAGLNPGISWKASFMGSPKAPDLGAFGGVDVQGNNPVARVSFPAPGLTWGKSSTRARRTGALSRICDFT